MKEPVMRWRRAFNAQARTLRQRNAGSPGELPAEPDAANVGRRTVPQPTVAERPLRPARAAALMLSDDRLIYSQIAAHPQLLHDFFYVDNPVTFDRDNSWGSSSTGYAGDLPIAEFAKFDLISGSYEDRSPIHSPYDYE